MSSSDRWFYAGILSALAVVALHDAQTIFENIVETVDEVELIKVARRDGVMRWSGLSKYKYGRKQDES